jgi:hypothetical protein
MCPGPSLVTISVEVCRLCRAHTYWTLKGFNAVVIRPTLHPYFKGHMVKTLIAADMSVEEEAGRMTRADVKAESLAPLT